MHSLKPRRGQFVLDYMGHETRYPATIVGDLAIFRQGDTARYGWQVYHVQTRSHVHKAMPPRFIGPRDTCVASARQLKEWAAAWQAACPEWFKALQDAQPGQIGSAATSREATAAAIEKGRAL